MFSRPRRASQAWWVIPFAWSAAGCSEKTSVRVPLLHRQVASACPTDRPQSNTSQFPPPLPGTNECRTDSDCTQGQNGRCVLPLPLGPLCSYDECFSDGDCDGGAVCACRNAPTGNNACVHGGCRTDSDCSGHYCSPSYACKQDGIVAYECHTSGDLCVDDKDCADAGIDAICTFDSQRRLWACFLQGCPV
jgi:hypothetical protein